MKVIIQKMLCIVFGHAFLGAKNHPEWRQRMETNGIKEFRYICIRCGIEEWKLIKGSKE